MGKYIDFLDISNNSLTGELPTTVFKNARMTTVNLSNNKLSGSIKGSFVTGFDSIGRIYLNNNRLTGIIPTQMAELDYIDLSGNDLHGSIPLNVLTSTSIESLNLAGNRLSGTLPSEACVFAANGATCDLSGNKYVHCITEINLIILYVVCMIFILISS